jgi:hypothetical protein
MTRIVASTEYPDSMARGFCINETLSGILAKRKASGDSLYQ